MLVTEELTLRWGECPGLSGGTQSSHEAPKQTRKQEGRSGTQSRRRTLPPTGLGQDRRNMVVTGT